MSNAPERNDIANNTISNPSSSPHRRSLGEELAEDRDEIAVLAERDDYLGAWGRIALAMIDGEQPTVQDCKDANLEPLIAFLDTEGEE